MLTKYFVTIVRRKDFGGLPLCTIVQKESKTECGTVAGQIYKSNTIYCSTVGKI